jgi:hypothetical protein
MPLCCVECKPCNGGQCLLPGLFKSRPRPAHQRLRRAFGKVKKQVGGTRSRRRRAGSFSSVRAVFWPLMSMRSEADARNDADADGDSRAPPGASTDDRSVVVVSAGARAPSPSLDNGGGGTPGAAASTTTTTTTAARVLAVRARLTTGEVPVPVPVPPRAAPPPPPKQQQQQLYLTTASPRQLALAMVPAAAAAKQVSSSSSIGAAARGAAAAARHGSGVGDGVVEAACGRFERHLMEMVVGERKVADLTDVEELLCCWEELRCPAFVQLVGRFYGELCMDLFAARGGGDDDDDEDGDVSHLSSRGFDDRVFVRC